MLLFRIHRCRVSEKYDSTRHAYTFSEIITSRRFIWISYYIQPRSPELFGPPRPLGNVAFIHVSVLPSSLRVNSTGVQSFFNCLRLDRKPHNKRVVGPLSHRFSYLFPLQSWLDESYKLIWKWYRACKVFISVSFYVVPLQTCNLPPTSLFLSSFRSLYICLSHSLFPTLFLLSYFSLLLFPTFTDLSLFYSFCLSSLFSPFSFHNFSLLVVYNNLLLLSYSFFFIFFFLLHILPHIFYFDYLYLSRFLAFLPYLSFPLFLISFPLSFPFYFLTLSYSFLTSLPSFFFFLLLLLYFPSYFIFWLPPFISFTLFSFIYLCFLLCLSHPLLFI